MTTDDIKAMRELRNNGCTYQAIAEKFGCTKQYVSHLIGQRSRKNSVEIESIVYDGIYQVFRRDHKMTFGKFATIVYGWERPDSAAVEKIRRFICGQGESRLTLSQINNICYCTGLSYENTFRRRR